MKMKMRNQNKCLDEITFHMISYDKQNKKSSLTLLLHKIKSNKFKKSKNILYQNLHTKGIPWGKQEIIKQELFKRLIASNALHQHK